MVTRHNVYTMPSVTNKFRADTTWTVDGYGKPYISETNTTYDLGQSYAASKRVTQTQDEWGNLTNMKWGIDMWRCIRTTWPGRC